MHRIFLLDGISKLPEWGISPHVMHKAIAASSRSKLPEERKEYISLSSIQLIDQLLKEYMSLSSTQLINQRLYQIVSVFLVGAFPYPTAPGSPPPSGKDSNCNYEHRLSGDDVFPFFDLGQYYISNFSTTP